MTLQDLIDKAAERGADPADVWLGYEGDVDNRWTVYGIDSARLEPITQRLDEPVKLNMVLS